MIPKSFAEHFHILSDAPNGIQKMREMIFQLAVKGKLVPQDLNDEPASVLLKKIKVEKEKLIKEGKIKKQKPLPPIYPDEVPHELPVSWAWVRLGNVTNYGIADKVEPGYINDGTWVLELENIEKTTSRLLVRGRYPEKEFKSTKNVFIEGDVLYGKLRPYLDKVLVADEPGVCTTEMIPIQSYGGINPFFLRIALKAPDFIAYANSSTHGMNLPRLGTEKARLFTCALPPIAEQKRIVAKVDQLIALCDELEARQKKRAEDRITLNRACLNVLTSADEDSVQNAWQRISDNFDLLYDYPENVSELRQAILQLAVMGRLVSQDPKEEPGSVLVKKIKTEKEKLIKEGKISKSKPLPPINPEDMPYELPDGWEFVRLGDVYDVRDGTHDTPKYVKTGYPLVTSKNIYGSRLDLTSAKFISAADHRAICQRSGVDRMDILFAMIGSIGNPVIVDVEAEFSIKNVALFKYYDRKLSSPKYLRHYLSYSVEEMKNRATGGVQAFISLSYLRNYLIPLPPLAEQKRIVAKVDQLMVLYKELAAKLKQTQSAAESLMGAVLNELTTA